MSDDNFHLDRFEELFDYLEELTKTDNPDLQEVAITSLQAMINDQLAFIRNQLDTGVLPPERAQESMQLLESHFVYGYLVGAGSFVEALVDEEPGGAASIEAMRQAFTELYLDNGERNWKACQAVPDDDTEFEAGFDAGTQDLRRFLSRLQGMDIGPSNAIAAFIFDRMTSVEEAPSSAGIEHTGNSHAGELEDHGVSLPENDVEIASLLATMSDPKRYANLESDQLRRLIHAAIDLFGIHGDDRLRNILDVLYPPYRDKDDEESRRALYREIVNEIEAGSTGHDALTRISHQ